LAARSSRDQQGLCKSAIFTGVKDLNQGPFLVARRRNKHPVISLAGADFQVTWNTSAKLLRCGSSFGMVRAIFPGWRGIAAG
jgi:hypothetical protein